MRIFYFYPFEDIPGVEEKVKWQIQSLRDIGINCIAYFIFSGSPPPHHNEYIQTVEIPRSNDRVKIVERIKKEFFILNFLKYQISSLSGKDILYMRIPYPSPFLSRILYRPRDCKIVVEYQNIEPAEYISVGKYWYLVIDYLFGDDIRRYSDAIVGVTDEITNYESAPIRKQ